ncbi:MAG: DmsE family decaheme c-type cytochrome [Elusimicrobiota bacterium]
MKEKTAAIVIGIGALCVMLTGIGARSAVAEGGAEYVGAETCVGCHDAKGASYKDSLHGRKLPITKKVTYEKSCETCHGPGSKHVAAGGDKTDPGFKTIGKPKSEDCMKCHKGGETMMWDISSHAQADLSCNTCHSVHEGKGRKNLKASSTDSCLQCHKKVGLALDMPSHHPVKEGKVSCTDCHNPHGGQNGNLRAESVTETCYKCHAEKAGPFIYSHPPVQEDCGICHKPHGASQQKMLKWSSPRICMACHNGHHEDSGATWVANIQRRGDCTTCHPEIHGSDRTAIFHP